MRHRRTDAGQLILVHPLDHRCKDGLLVRKQQIERRPRDFAALRDVAHCGASKTISAEHFRRAFDDALMLAAGNRHLLAPFFRKRLSNWRSDIITDYVISSKTRKQAKRRSHVNSEIHLKTWKAYQRAWGPFHETELEELLRSRVTDNILHTDPSPQTHVLPHPILPIPQPPTNLHAPS